MKNKLIPLYLLFTYCLLCPSLGLATDVAQVVNNILNPVSAFTDAFYKICHALGILLTLGAAAQYHMHRKNPIQIRLSNVFFLLIIGIIIFCLPFIIKLSVSAKPIEASINRQHQYSTFSQTSKQPPRAPQSDALNESDWYNNYSH